MIIDDDADYTECPDLWKAEIDMGLPPGVKVADLLQNTQNSNSLRQAYSLAIQSNKITDYLGRFDSIQIPDSCKAVVTAQISKLKAIRTVIWNTLISMSIGEINIEEEGLQALLDKQAGDSLALMEVEKIAHAIKMDETSNWAVDIASIIDTANKSVIESSDKDVIETLEMGTITSQPGRTQPNNTVTKEPVLCPAGLKSSAAYVNLGFVDDDSSDTAYSTDTMNEQRNANAESELKDDRIYINICEQRGNFKKESAIEICDK